MKRVPWAPWRRSGDHRLSEDCRCITRVNANGALIVIADRECDRHRPTILDAP